MFSFCVFSFMKFSDTKFQESRVLFYSLLLSWISPDSSNCRVCVAWLSECALSICAIRPEWYMSHLDGECIMQLQSRKEESHDWREYFAFSHCNRIIFPFLPPFSLLLVFSSPFILYLSMYTCNLQTFYYYHCTHTGTHSPVHNAPPWLHTFVSVISTLIVSAVWLCGQ